MNKKIPVFTFLSIIFFSTGLPADNSQELKFLQGKFNPAKQSEFIKIPAHLSVKKNIFLQIKTIRAFEKMAKAAKKDGVELYVLSATRNYYAQKSIWEAKYAGKRKSNGINLKKSYPDQQARTYKILEYSSMPGTSRHHWGTDIDISFRKNNSSGMLINRTYESGKGKKVYDWMVNNASRFGFCQPYKGDPKKRTNGAYQLGYQEEKWHWTYTPLASQYLSKYKKLQKRLLPEGFSGTRFGRKIFLQYVLNINDACR